MHLPREEGYRHKQTPHNGPALAGYGALRPNASLPRSSTRALPHLQRVKYATARWVDWYNNRRLHGSLDHWTPAESEAAHYATRNREPQPV